MSCLTKIFALLPIFVLFGCNVNERVEEGIKQIEAAEKQSIQRIESAEKQSIQRINANKEAHQRMMARLMENVTEAAKKPMKLKGTPMKVVTVHNGKVFRDEVLQDRVEAAASKAGFLLWKDAPIVLRVVLAKGVDPSQSWLDPWTGEDSGLWQFAIRDNGVTRGFYSSYVSYCYDKEEPEEPTCENIQDGLNRAFWMLHHQVSN